MPGERVLRTARRQEPAPRPRDRHERWLPLVFLGLAAASLAPALRFPDRFGASYDWRYFQSTVEAARRSVLWWGEAPLWNPWACGGEVLLANPQSEVAAPTFLLHLVFGTALGAKLALLAYLFFAYHGMYLLARREGLSAAGAFLAAVLYGGGGWLALHLAAGHSNFAGAGLFPYAVLFYRRALDRMVWAIALGAVAAWIVGLGGTSTAPLALVLLSVLAGMDAIRGRSLRPFAVLAAGAASACVVGAPRVLPALEFALDHPRRSWVSDATSPWELLRFGFGWPVMEPVPGKPFWRHEYAWRLAWVAAPLLAWSLWTSLRRRPASARPARASGLGGGWWVVALGGAAIAIGDAWPYGPWWILQHLPLFRDLRVPSRFVLLLAFASPLLCGRALDDLRARWEDRRWGRWLAPAVVALAALDGVAYHAARFRDVFTLEAPVAGRGVAFEQVRGDWSSMIVHVLAGRGVIDCDEEAPLQRAAVLDEGAVPQARLSDPAAGSLREAEWSPSHVVLEVETAVPATVLLNRNWNEHWTASPGRVVKVGPKHERDQDGGRLGVELPPGRHRLIVRYRPASFVAGMVLFALGGPILLAAAWRARRSRPTTPAG